MLKISRVEQLPLDFRYKRVWSKAGFCCPLVTGKRLEILQHVDNEVEKRRVVLLMYR